MITWPRLPKGLEARARLFAHRGGPGIIRIKEGKYLSPSRNLTQSKEAIDDLSSIHSRGWSRKNCFAVRIKRRQHHENVKEASFFLELCHQCSQLESGLLNDDFFQIPVSAGNAAGFKPSLTRNPDT